MTPAERHDFAQRLLAWYDRAKRPLPWRDTDDPYAVIVSEVMLQQTQVAKVVPYYERFLATFPTVQRLAEASEDEALVAWQGLGYYSRARRLREAAQRIVDVYDGAVPDTVAELRTLPGIGPYTAGAVASIAFHRPEPVVDANVSRVLARVFALPGDPRTGATSGALWAHAAALVPRIRPGDHNAGMMELGALVCRSGAPDCSVCPVARYCRALAEGSVSRYPELAARRKTVAVEDIAVLVQQHGAVALVRRPDGGLWAGMWELPRVQRDAGEALAVADARAPLEVCGLRTHNPQPFGVLRHSVTHFRIRLHGYASEWESGEPAAVACADARWVSQGDIHTYALPSPQGRLLGLAFGDADDSGPV